MNKTCNYACGFSLLLAFVALHLPFNAEAASKPGVMIDDLAIVLDIKGTASYSEIAGEWKPLTLGTLLSPGATVRTGPKSTAVLTLGETKSAVRLEPETTLVLEKMAFERAGRQTRTQTLLDLKEGQIAGAVPKGLGRSASKYDVKTATGVCGIRGTEFVIEKNGTVHVISGEVRVEVSVTLPNGEVVGKVVTVRAGQSLTFPASGVLNPAIVEQLEAARTPQSIQVRLVQMMADVIEVAGPIAALSIQFQALSPAQQTGVQTETGFQADPPVVEIISP
jgi:molybdopterin-binding protein